MTYTQHICHYIYSTDVLLNRSIYNQQASEHCPTDKIHSYYLVITKLWDLWNHVLHAPTCTKCVIAETRCVQRRTITKYLYQLVRCKIYTRGINTISIPNFNFKRMKTDCITVYIHVRIQSKSRFRQATSVNSYENVHVCISYTPHWICENAKISTPNHIMHVAVVMHNKVQLIQTTSPHKKRNCPCIERTYHPLLSSPMTSAEYSRWRRRGSGQCLRVSDRLLHLLVPRCDVDVVTWVALDEHVIQQRFVLGSVLVVFCQAEK